METRQGYKTTEFWVTVGMGLATILGAIQGAVSPKTAAIIGTIITAIYALCRTATKLPAQKNSKK